MLENYSNGRPAVAFAGLTAAGKTTHAKILAEELGFEYISATDIILDILQIRETTPDRVWFSSYDKIEQARKDDRIDIELESRITNITDKQDGLVLDTWAMAWIYSGTMPMVRLWIESDEDSRTRKCYVSQGTNKTLDMDDCRKLVTKKDTDTRIKFQRRLGFDIFTDRERYDIIFNNTMLIPEATEEVAREGIKVFRKVMLKAVQYCISNIIKPNYDPNNELGRSIIEESNGMITRIRNINNYD